MQKPPICNLQFVPLPFLCCLVQDQQIIKELTMIVGYAHMLETHPDLMNYSAAIRKHLEAFADLTCSAEHHELCKRSWRILGILDGGADFKDVA